MDLQPFERNRQSILAAPVPVAPGIHVVLELFDKPGGFTAADRKFVAAAADFSTELLRQAVSERQTQRVLIDAVEAALKAQRAGDQCPAGRPGRRAAAPLPAAVMDQLRAGLDASANAVVDAKTSLDWPRPSASWPSGTARRPSATASGWSRACGSCWTRPRASTNG